MTTPNYADHVPPSPSAQRALVAATRGVPAKGSSSIGLQSRRLIDFRGRPTELGQGVATHIETEWAANRERWG